MIEGGSGKGRFGASFVFSNVDLVTAERAGGEAFDEHGGYVLRDLDNGVFEKDAYIADAAHGGSALLVEKTCHVLGANMQHLAGVDEKRNCVLRLFVFGSALGYTIRV